jgi:hypothetical protein
MQLRIKWFQSNFIQYQVVLDKTQDVLRGENVLKIEPRVAAQGAYVLRIEINGETTTGDEKSVK